LAGFLLPAQRKFQHAAPTTPSRDERTAQMITKSSTVATYAGATGAVYFGLTANEWAAFGGLGIALFGFFVNLYFKAQHLKLAREKAAKEFYDE
jgi:hypothetical protein